MESPLPLCLYCSQSPSRSWDEFCCDGCKLLADLLRSDQGDSDSSGLFEDPVLVRAFGRSQGGFTRFEVHLDSLACEACLQSLATLEKKIPGLRDLQWNRRTSILSFRFVNGQERASDAFRFLEGLQLSPRWLAADGQNGDEHRRGTLRLGLTAALAGNIMLFAVPNYAGLSGSWQDIFEGIQFLLFLPILAWSAQPFYRTAWTSLCLRRLSVDLPLTIAFLMGSAFSILSLMRGEHQIYFDSLAGFLFLILWSRAMLEGSLTKNLASPRLEMFFDRPVYPIRRGGENRSVSWSEIQPGDVLLLQAGDRLPVDGLLRSPWAEVETAWMTGEKSPHWRLAGCAMQAGTRLLSADAEIDVTQPANDTDFARLLEHLRGGGEKLVVSEEARIGSALVIACLLGMGILFVFGKHLGVDEILRRSVALLITACPCAVSFAAPLARAKANRLALKKGFWVRNGHVWPRLVRVRRIAFDKTGTLTGGLFTIAATNTIIDPHWKKIFLSLENISSHPIAESLRRLWAPLPLFPVTEARETIGHGVDGRIGQSHYEVRGSETDEADLRLDLLRDGQKVVNVLLQDEASPGVERLLERFHRTYDLYLVSGDRRRRVEEFGRRFGFRPDRVFSELSPAGKVDVLTQIEPDLYFGDGTNDLPAMKKAPVSIAVNAASLEAQAAADVVMFDADFGRCEDLFEIAHATKSLNRRNLVLAVAYNICTATASLAGLIHPLAAAVLMPIASGLLLLSTLRGTADLRRLEKST